MHKHYSTATGATAFELDGRVNKLLEQGFELYGSPYLKTFANGTSEHCQAMTHAQIGGPAKFDPSKEMPKR